MTPVRLLLGTIPIFVGGRDHRIVLHAIGISEWLKLLVRGGARMALIAYLSLAGRDGEDAG